ncbi:helix-turn-helix transcriptional regulator [Citrobacter portucalensis]|uniref:helix-turn-helix transcriptional regulator n=1 Tax=Citrobacter portucalensis TaxID=1639133 RepID=UPI001EC00FB7|nr:helix-turn-helix transcriptional regulator [Citrobacter portucalensis]EDS3841709.1 helix-turn-helix transcriptional regulator [Salmonella enterica]WNI88073.1 helix-turn-helix transcriptional regulator [Citrobacter portucalensis]
MQIVVCKHILKWVEDNLISELNVSDMAASTGYSRRTLELWFSAHYGMSPGKYLNRRRMTRAAVLLRLTRLSVTEIALLLHHSSNQSFARAFRRFFGVTPTDYRNAKEWDLSALQASFFYAKEIPFDVTVCILSEQYITGRSCTCTDSYLYNSNNLLTDYIRREVTRLTKAGAENIYLSGGTAPPQNMNESRGGLLVAIVTVGTLVNVRTEDTMVMPGGRFCRYSFSCKWEEYTAHTNMIFIHIMSENKFFYTGGNCYVHFTGEPEHVEKKICCEMFIPVQ